MSTCRFCKDYRESRETGPLVRYGTRHYAHLRCGIEKRGSLFLGGVPQYQLEQLPYFLLKDLGMLDYVQETIKRRKVEEAAQRAMRQGTPAWFCKCEECGTVRWEIMAARAAGTEDAICCEMVIPEEVSK